MTFRHHLPSRRDALLGAGQPVCVEPGAEAGSPPRGRESAHARHRAARRARWARRGPRRSAIPTGSRWRGDRALVARRQATRIAARRLLRAQPPRLAEPAPALQGAAGHHPLHATATPYRERSHFDGQDVLESGVARPGGVDNRLGSIAPPG